MLLRGALAAHRDEVLPDPDPEYRGLPHAGSAAVLPIPGQAGRPGGSARGRRRLSATLAVLERKHLANRQGLAQSPGLRGTPIRVLLRGTEEYVHAPAEPLWPPLLDAEAEQLARGDIPYFFRFYGRRGIHYYAEPTLTKVKRLPLHGDVPQLDPMLSLERGCASLGQNW